MDDQHEQPGGVLREQPAGAATYEQPAGATTQPQPSEDEMRAAYEAELNRITSSELILQTAVSLINVAGRRLGFGGPSSGDPSSPGASSGGPGAERDLEQVRDAIDGVSGLMPILERRMPRDLGPLRDAVAQLKMAYAREARAGESPGTAQAPAATHSNPADGGAGGPQEPGESAGSPVPAEQGKPAGSAGPAEQGGPARGGDTPAEGEKSPGPGPAQASGRLWVPGR